MGVPASRLRPTPSPPSPPLLSLDDPPATSHTSYATFRDVPGVGLKTAPPPPSPSPSHAHRAPVSLGRPPETHVCRVFSSLHRTIELRAPEAVTKAHGTIFTYYAVPYRLVLAEYNSFVLAYTTARGGLRAAFGMSELRYQGIVRHKGSVYVEFRTQRADARGEGTTSTNNGDTAAAASVSGSVVHDAVHHTRRPTDEGRLILRTPLTTNDQRLLAGVHRLRVAPWTALRGDASGATRGLPIVCAANASTFSFAEPTTIPVRRFPCPVVPTKRSMTLVDASRSIEHDGAREGPSSPPSSHVPQPATPAPLSRWTHTPRRWTFLWEREGV